MDVFQLGVLHIGFEALRVISVDTNADRVTTVATAPLRLDLMNSLGGVFAGRYVTAMLRVAAAAGGWLRGQPLMWCLRASAGRVISAAMAVGLAEPQEDCQQSLPERSTGRTRPCPTIPQFVPRCGASSPRGWHEPEPLVQYAEQVRALPVLGICGGGALAGLLIAIRGFFLVGLIWFSGACPWC